MAAPDVAELLVQVDINRQGLNETVVVLRSAGRFFISSEDLQRWRLRTPDTSPLTHEGRRYYPIDALPGATFRLDEARQTLAITASPEAFGETVAPSRLVARRAQPVLPQPGGFLNYSLSSAHAAGATVNAGLFEAGFFSREGVLTNTVLAPALGEVSDWHRLETTYTIDDPENRRSLRAGDAVTRAGAWGRAVRFGGVQWATNFSTQPGFIAIPVSAALGQAALPSTVDVFVNNALVTRRNVPPGPFSITDIPVVTGSGDIRVVVRDLLGREQIFIQPFYGSSALLRKGISDYSFEAGAVREDFGIASNHYGERIAAATYRTGITDVLTGEARGEHSRSSTTAGASATWLAGRLAVLTGTAALSHSDAGGGALAGFGLERSARTVSVAFQSVVTNPQFRQAGMSPGELPRRRQSIGNLGLQFGAIGSVSVTHVIQEFRDQASLAVTTLAYGVPVPRIGYLSVSAVRTSGQSASNALFTTLAIPFGDAASASVGLERTHDQQTGRRDNLRVLAVQKSLPLGEGYGYRFNARDENLLGSVSRQTGFGTYTAEAARSEDGHTATRLNASGGVGVIAGHAFLSRSITDSFAVVRVADFAGVRVLHDNQVAARTDAGGYAVLPRLRPYDRNRVAVDQSDLPFEASIGTLELPAVPYFRSGVYIEFPVRRVRAATLRIVLEDGADLPSGALARIEGKDEQFPVALGGQAYIEGFEPAMNRLHVTWKEQSCVLDVSYPPGADPLPDLGVFICKGVKP